MNTVLGHGVALERSAVEWQSKSFHGKAAVAWIAAAVYWQEEALKAETESSLRASMEARAVCAWRCARESCGRQSHEMHGETRRHDVA